MLKSYTGNNSRLITIQFFENKPVKAYCSCPVGKSGLCCNAIALFIQLNFFHCHKKLSASSEFDYGDWYRRDVSKIEEEVKGKVAWVKPVQSNFYSTFLFCLVHFMSVLAQRRFRKYLSLT